ncbi:unnamed protein product [Eretmochelys imbricata]
MDLYFNHELFENVPSYRCSSQSSVCRQAHRERRVFFLSNSLSPTGLVRENRPRTSEKGTALCHTAHDNLHVLFKYLVTGVSRGLRCYPGSYLGSERGQRDHSERSSAAGKRWQPPDLLIPPARAMWSR